MMCTIYVIGNLCTGVGGKKKKKMMYVTTKNAGNKSCLMKQLTDVCCYSVSFSSNPSCPSVLHLFFSSLRVWQTRDITLWGGGQGPAFQEENPDFDWCSGCGAAETEEQAFTEGSTSLWHYYSMYEICYINVQSTVKL